MMSDSLAGHVSRDLVVELYEGRIHEREPLWLFLIYFDFEIKTGELSTTPVYSVNLLANEW
jgi:hypothetical protein